MAKKNKPIKTTSVDNFIKIGANMPEEIRPAIESVIEKLSKSEIDNLAMTIGYLSRSGDIIPSALATDRVPILGEIFNQSLTAFLEKGHYNRVFPGSGDRTSGSQITARFRRISYIK